MIDPTSAPGPWWKRLMWLATIWLASVATLFVIASIIRWWIAPS